MESKSLTTTAEWEERLGVDARRLRLEQSLTQAELAERSNVSLSAVKSLEGGRGSSLATLIRVARALGRTDWLSSFAPVEPSVSPIALLRERQRVTPLATRRVRRPRSNP
ncbi:MAG TPA: helix-turn-helix transcriptional regulator [Acidimicrobiales bacterium]|nr:helix-turn-helix transcriptional regulator [Acidimicrobiales bacterium]